MQQGDVPANSIFGTFLSRLFPPRHLVAAPLIGVVLVLLGLGSIFALFLYLTLYLQNYLGLSPLEAGLRYLPITLASFFVAPIAGALSDRIGGRPFLAGGLARHRVVLRDGPLLLDDLSR